MTQEQLALLLAYIDRAHTIRDLRNPYGIVAAEKKLEQLKQQLFDSMDGEE